jgi:hypothetical protein
MLFSVIVCVVFLKKDQYLYQFSFQFAPHSQTNANENKLKTLDSPHDDVKVNLTSLSIRSPETLVYFCI